MHLGVLEGVSYDDARLRLAELAGRSYGDMLDYAFAGGGESVRDVAARVRPPMETAMREHAAAGSAAIAVYAHNTVLRVLLAEAAGIGVAGYIRFEQCFGAVSRIDVDRDRISGDLWAAASIAYCNLDPQRCLPRP
jgi:broad specificity phosphatase PhoE